ncbi:fructosamine kinase family protein [Methylomonas methanica]|uniref:Fructosamine/Ketosamine-3-kinase n=1 Tax=Methylomonas methanica (strain DSM 25384 / MC09) TaxID=857087 RepID=G0A7I3_METMM|nr:fructosamine kinase family protein [Methylomonas methanica]AEG00653.1 Fructosamine/Ketosamine-3-kinase [Methylomonas methanica MC09]
MTVSASLIQHLQQATGRDLQNHRLTRVGGGDINTAFRLQATGIDWFIKLNRASLLNMFAAEAAGLQELASLQQVKVPQVVLFGEHDNHAYLLLEYEALGSLRGDSASRFGSQLARLHRQPQAFFGWPIDNTIGSTPQHNERRDDWVDFWQQQRLGKQLQFAAENGFTGPLQTRGLTLLEKLPAFFTRHRPHPSLLHGDLWGGNAASDSEGNPIMFDPACYYGDRETDIAMTELFGGFGSNFYSAYNNEYPLDPDYKTRKTLYNLYHILNHLNLFGGGYLSQANSMIDRLLSEIK